MARQKCRVVKPQSRLRMHVIGAGSAEVRPPPNSKIPIQSYFRSRSREERGRRGSRFPVNPFSGDQRRSGPTRPSSPASAAFDCAASSKAEQEFDFFQAHLLSAIRSPASQQIADFLLKKKGGRAAKMTFLVQPRPNTQTRRAIRSRQPCNGDRDRPRPSKSLKRERQNRRN